MKKLIILLALVLIGITITAQTTQSTDTTKKVYCILNFNIRNSLITGPSKVAIDWGDGNDFVDLVNNYGKKIKTKAEAINYLVNKGWKIQFITNCSSPNSTMTDLYFIK